MATPRPHNRRILLRFFILLFTPLGDSMAASGRQTLLIPTASDPRQTSATSDGHHLQPTALGFYCVSWSCSFAGEKREPKWLEKKLLKRLTKDGSHLHDFLPPESKPQ
ncbi:hypothetical protein Rs2_41736 [Raphanus sativus]|nr:hypothetical protein Rs2_41736 [Raphanus sativus]